MHRDTGGNCRAGATKQGMWDCFGTELCCHNCVVTLHAKHPAHRIQEWIGLYFVTISLKKLGLCVQLGHLVGKHCLLPQRAFNDDFTLIDTNGIHEIGLDFCSCEFYHSLARLTNNTGLQPRKDHYEVFLWIVQEWRHLKMLNGECAVLCPACPQPGRNLPDNWEEAPKEIRWLYNSVDPGLSRRWAYFVEETAYKKFIQSQGGMLQQKSTCSSHNAVNMADVKISRGLAATRFYRRYTNMDFLFFSTLRGRGIDTLNISYDIACQWHKNLWERMSAMPSKLRLDHATKSITHILKCQTMFLFNFSKNVGRTDVTSSTKEMGPGLWRDTLDDHFGDWNWKKVVGLGSTLLRKIKEAKEESEAHQIAFEELNGALRLETTGPWTIAIKHWEDNPNDLSVTNPFKAKVIPIMQAAVQLKLAQLEAAELQQGTDVSMHTDVSSSIFIASGIDLENEQRRLKVDIGKQGLHTTDTQMGTVQRQRNALQCKLILGSTFKLSTPLQAEQPSRSTSDVIKPEDSQLWLPSTLCSKPIPCNARLLKTEWELRYAQAGDALEEIRQYLCLRDYMYTFKRDWLLGQSANTRAQNALSRIEARATAAAEKYRAAHTALSSLAHVLGKVGWDHKYRVLDRKNDICGMSVPKRGESEGRRQLSWIWLVEGVEDDEDEVIQDSLRVEWCKARARYMQWAEEVELLQEEMRRVSCFLRWHTSWWSTKIMECTLADSAPESMAANEAELDLYLPELPLP
ncbi:hypothetical protein BDR03DRAFT_934885 [Suillus americanus]|nr:hypothetical protein BDR03DRAFT_934885 [Suillus americanus]